MQTSFGQGSQLASEEWLAPEELSHGYLDCLRDCARALHRAMGSVLHHEPSGEGARPHLVHMVEAARSPRHWTGRWVPTDSTRRRRRARGSSLIGQCLAPMAGTVLCTWRLSIESEAENVKGKATPEGNRAPRRAGHASVCISAALSGGGPAAIRSTVVRCSLLLFPATSRHPSNTATLVCHAIMS
jgi:hypothetical protein